MLSIFRRALRIIEDTIKENRTYIHSCLGNSAAFDKNETFTLDDYYIHSESELANYKVQAVSMIYIKSR